MVSSIRFLVTIGDSECVEWFTHYRIILPFVYFCVNMNHDDSLFGDEFTSFDHH